MNQKFHYSRLFPQGEGKNLTREKGNCIRFGVWEWGTGVVVEARRSEVQVCLIKIGEHGTKAGKKFQSLWREAELL